MLNMVNSRNIDDLREDVALNCRKLIELCDQEGLPVLVTGTYRDAEYQQWCYMNGTSATPKLGPHGYRLAFDFCKNAQGHEYDDVSFFVRVASIAKQMGFQWGGDWKSFPDRPHLEWLGDPPIDRTEVGRKVVSKMPPYGADEEDTTIPVWAADAMEWAIEYGFTDGTHPNQPITLARMLTILYRYDRGVMRDD